MKLIGGKDGKTLQVLQHARIDEPSGSLLVTDVEPDEMCIKNGKRETRTFFRKFHMCRHLTNLPIKVNDWISECTPETFAKFKMHTADWDCETGAPIDVDNPPKRGCVIDPVTSFKKGTKCDAVTSKPLQDQKQWDPWWITTQVQARAQDVQEVLDPKFLPVGKENMALFQEKQKYMHAVSAITLLMDKEKSVVIPGQKIPRI